MKLSLLRDIYNIVASGLPAFVPEYVQQQTPRASLIRRCGCVGHANLLFQEQQTTSQQLKALQAAQVELLVHPLAPVSMQELEVACLRAKTVVRMPVQVSLLAYM
jgi:hypothetical protein